MVTPETRDLVRHTRNQRTCVHVNVRNVDVGRVPRWGCVYCVYAIVRSVSVGWVPV